MKKLIFLLLIMRVLCSCGLELTKVELDLEDGFIPEVAVSSYLVPDSTVILKLMLTRAAYSNHQTVAKLKNATIEQLSDNRVFTMSQQQEKNYIELSSSELKPVAGEIYKLRVETENPKAVMEAVDTIPNVTPLLNASILPVDKSSKQLGQITFKPTSGKVQYYEIAVYSKDAKSTDPLNIFYQIPIASDNQIITREDYYPGLLMIGAANPASLLFRTEYPDEIVSVSFNYQAPAMVNSSGYSTIDHYIKIELRTVSYACFRYKTSLYKQGYAASGDLLYGMASPATVFSNIDGGLGIFSGYSKCDTVINVPGRTGLVN